MTHEISNPFGIGNIYNSKALSVVANRINMMSRRYSRCDYEAVSRGTIMSHNIIRDLI